ncbi:uncharacterized protein G2W53_040153 [Senna tora]|uniref:Uncharacterized protein n=1 Tax=Senna tora TaxID=362788 RepID=A0A834SUH4_9FABA|nr:uncharacterized protein G2W53_040153 [Senna tora]
MEIGLLEEEAMSQKDKKWFQKKSVFSNI